jgi:hypothetical protein
MTNLESVPKTPMMHYSPPPGGTLVLRKKFSASAFFAECAEHDVTVIQYIGELCRYLCATKPAPTDTKHRVRLAVGNGLRPDIWQQFVERFNIAQVK